MGSRLSTTAAYSRQWPSWDLNNVSQAEDPVPLPPVQVAALVRGLVNVLVVFFYCSEMVSGYFLLFLLPSIHTLIDGERVDFLGMVKVWGWGRKD